MNGWRSRLVLCALGFVLMQLHADVTHALPNSPEGMTVFHLSAALVDLSMLYFAPFLIEGRLCDDVQALCLVSIVGNALGWALYLAAYPPVFYNVFMWGLTSVQAIRILILDRDDADSVGLHMVRRPGHVGA